MNARIIRPQQQTKLPEIGKIKVGELVKNGDSEYPRSLDYFKPTGDYAPLFYEAYGEKPNLLEIVFPSNNARECCFERLELRQGSKLYAEGDGETFRAYSEKSKDYVTVTKTEFPDLMEKLSAKAGGQWRSILTMRFLLLKVRSVLGVWSLSTHAEASSIPEIISAYDNVLANAGRVAFIPFDLSVQKVTSQKPGSKSTYSVIKLVANLGMSQLEMVRSLAESRPDIRGVLTSERIESEAKQITGGLAV